MFPRVTRIYPLMQAVSYTAGIETQPPEDPEELELSDDPLDPLEPEELLLDPEEPLELDDPELPDDPLDPELNDAAALTATNIDNLRSPTEAEPEPEVNGRHSRSPYVWDL